ncbi:hypothetical protein [Arthrobacter woluwensis]|uniref:Uncharacterized protein n=1 Tax=Arthrobacter woluwensis TaxID=156980 RepID=A0A1H4I507_9MICC|nr:hypothetical protein [Arthrobacter woluwensis]SEB29000.1 hypothetical protein SAMN04489745_0035 [Arthrobacter woluwensis]SEC53357.1 hypothetical protein SAMN04489745_3112 [Arthrobacter woluwensis]
MTDERDELTTDYVRDRFVDSMFTSAEASELAYADFAEVEEEQARFDAWLESVRAEARRPRVIENADELDKLPVRSVVLDRFGDPVKKKAQDWWQGIGYERDYTSETLAQFNPNGVTVAWEGGE